MQVRATNIAVIIGVFSWEVARMFPFVGVAVPRSFRHAGFMDQVGKDRAAEFAAKVMLQRGWDVARLSVESGLDIGTVRSFIDRERWPWRVKRNAIEEALGLELGELELVARGLREEEEDGDPVETAIRQSALNRANQNKLVGTYYEMLDGQEGGRRSG